MKLIYHTHIYILINNRQTHRKLPSKSHSHIKNFMLNDAQYLMFAFGTALGIIW